RPGRAWLAANSGFAASAGLALTLAHALPGLAVAPRETLARFCALPLGLLCLWEGWRTARPGAWGPEGAIEMRRPDVALVGWGLLGTVAASLALAAAGQMPFGLVVLDAGIALAIAAPIALRVLGVVVPDVLVTATLLAAAGGVLVARAAGGRCRHHPRRRRSDGPRRFRAGAAGPRLAARRRRRRAPRAQLRQHRAARAPARAARGARAGPRHARRRADPESAPPLGVALHEHRHARRPLPRGGRGGVPRFRGAARPPARRRGPARAHGRGGARARPRREARRHRR